MLRLPALLLAAALLGAPALHAQPTDARVRLDLRGATPHAPVQSLVGTLVAADAATLLLRTRDAADTLRVPREALVASFVTAGREPRWRAALRGAVRPALVGAALGALRATVVRDDDHPAGRVALSAAAWGAVSGAARAAWRPRERWHRTELAP